MRYKVYGSEMEHVFEEKDLGVTIDSQLTFEEHITAKVRIANNMVGLIRRSFSFLSCDLFRKLYLALVRPHLEYAQTVWSPHRKKLINMIENVQIRATKLVDGLSNLDYPARLRKLNIPTLLHRRARGAMIEMYKHFTVYSRETLSEAFQPRQRYTRPHNRQIQARAAKDGVTGVQTNSFYFRNARTWNDLPADIVNAKTLNSFKNALDRHWEELPTKFDHQYRDEERFEEDM